MLSKGWNEYLLGDVVTFRNGLNFTKADVGEEIKIVGVADFKKRSHLENFDDLELVKVTSKVRDLDLLASGDLLFVRSNGNKELIGRCLYFPYVGDRISFSGFTIRGRVNTSVIEPEFASYLMRSKIVTDQIFLGGSGTNISNLSQEILSNIEVSIPNLVEQRHIASVLGTWDKAIATSERILSNSLSHKKLLTQQMLSGKMRLHGFKNCKTRRETPHGSLPSDWGYRRIGEIAVEVSQKLGNASPYPVLSCTKHHGLVDSLSYFNKQVFSLDTSTYKVIPRDCFVYATNHIDEGSIGYQDLYDFGLVSPMYTSFKTNNEILKSYLFALLKTEHYRQIFASATNASVDRRGSLRWKDFKNLHIPVPPIDEQRAIANVLMLAVREVDVITSQLDRLREEKAALMAQLLTGKRRVHLSGSRAEVAV